MIDRRQAVQITAASAVLMHAPSWALSLGEISNKDAASSLKNLLEKCASAAVTQLGRPGGFLDDQAVRIALPDFMEDAGKILTKLGQGRRVEDLVVAMNRAAEQVVPAAKNILLGAVRQLSATDAKNIFTGGPRSVTDYFASKTREPLALQFKPIVTQATAKVSLAEKYNAMAGKAVKFGLMRQEDANLQTYITQKTLDGLYLTIGQKEQAFRADPAKAGSDMLTRILKSL